MMKKMDFYSYTMLALFLIFIALTASAITGCSSPSAARIQAGDSHADHDHEIHGDENPVDKLTHVDQDDVHSHESSHDDHEDSHDELSTLQNHDHEEHELDHEDEGQNDPHAGHDHSEEAGLIKLTDEQKRRIGLKLQVAESSTMSESRMFPGEVIENPDRVVHVVARADGIVREINKGLGEYVKDREILAWIESSDLGNAKTDYLEKKQQLELAKSDYLRESKIYENTFKLLQLLKTMPELAELESFQELDMGKNKGELIAAYTEYVYTKNVYELEKDLHEKEITSRNELLEAETAFRKAEANFNATCDEIAFSSERTHLELKRAREIAEISCNTAERNLHLMGLSEADILSLSNGSKSHTKMSYYPIKSPFAGYVTEKHLTLGEKIGSDDHIYTISDVSTVWVKFNVYQKDLDYVKTESHAIVNAREHCEPYTGTIDFVSPTIDEETRTVQAFITLNNKDGNLHPGLYVKVFVESDSKNTGILVPAGAVQVIDEEPVIFIEESDSFIAVPVTLGAERNDSVVIKSGLKPGQRYVVQGAFELKAKIVTSDLDPHAGHGH